MGVPVLAVLELDAWQPPRKNAKESAINGTNAKIWRDIEWLLIEGFRAKNPL
jgi:hypothetical protein